MRAVAHTASLLWVRTVGVLGMMTGTPRRRAACLLVSVLPLGGRAVRVLSPPWGATGLAAARSRGLAACVPPAETFSLADMPDFRGPGRLLKGAYKASLQVKPNQKLSDKKKRAVKHATQTIDTYASSLSVPMRKQLAAFQEVLRGLQPFEKALAELTLAAMEREGGRSLRDVERDFDLARRAVVRSGKEAAAECSKAVSAREAEELKAAGIKKIVGAFEDESGALLQLIQTAQALRRLPRPVSSESVLVLVGMPNVGKSSIVTETSTGTPEINDYPFTTRRLKMGHVVEAGRRYQVRRTVT